MPLSVQPVAGENPQHLVYLWRKQMQVEERALLFVQCNFRRGDDLLC